LKNNEIQKIVMDMSKFKSLIFLLVLLAAKTASAQYTDVINSNRPGKSMSAFSVGENVIQLESGINGTHEKHQLLGNESNGINAEFNIRWGLFFEQLEFSLELQHQTDQYKTYLGTETRNGLKQSILGAKYLLYDPYKNRKEKVNIYSWKANHKFKWNQFIPSVAAYAGVNMNFGSPFTFANDPKISPKLAIITQNQFSGGYVFVINIIADKITTDYPSYGYVMTLTKGFNEKWSGFLENQGFKSDFYSDALIRGGAAYLIRENIQLDASITTNFKNTPSVLYGGVGLSWRFDEAYQEVLIRSSDDSKDKDKDKKDKKKDKKKRKDEVELEKPTP